MPYRRNYPATVAEVLDANAKYKPDALRAVKELARAKPWRMNNVHRLEVFRAAVVKLAAAYGIPAPSVSAGGMSFYSPIGNAIVLDGHLSVVTLLHEFAHARL